MSTINPISAITSELISAGAKDKSLRFVIANEISGKGKIDANSDQQVTVDELKSAARAAGIDVSNLSAEELNKLQQDAIELTSFLKEGGTLYKDREGSFFNYEFIDDKTPPTVETVKSNLALLLSDEPVFRRGQVGPEITRLNNLLTNLGFKVSPGNEDKFTKETEQFVKEFQRNNNLLINLRTMKPDEDIVPGVIDSKTLKTMERAVKTEDPYLPLENKEIDKKTEYELVRQRVKEQLVNNGVDYQQAFSIGEKLSNGAVSVDRKMGSESLCYTAVKTTMDNVLGFPYQRFGTVTNPETGKRERGDYAKTAGYTLLAKNPDMFAKLDGFSRSDVQYLPPGSIVVYRPINAKGTELTSEAGHIGIQSMQIAGLPVINVKEQDGKILEMTVRKKDNTTKTYSVEDSFAVTKQALPERSELAVGKKLNGMTISSVDETEGSISSIKLKGYSKQQGTFYKTLEVKNDQIILDKLKIDHADISDKMRISPWTSSKVEVYFPIASKK